MQMIFYNECLLGARKNFYEILVQRKEQFQRGFADAIMRAK